MSSVRGGFLFCNYQIIMTTQSFLIIPGIWVTCFLIKVLQRSGILPQIPVISGLLDERSDPDAGFADVRTKATAVEDSVPIQTGL